MTFRNCRLGRPPKLQMPRCSVAMATFKQLGQLPVPKPRVAMATASLQQCQLSLPKAREPAAAAPLSHASLQRLYLYDVSVGAARRRLQRLHGRVAMATFQQPCTSQATSACSGCTSMTFRKCRWGRAPKASKASLQGRHGYFPAATPACSGCAFMPFRNCRLGLAWATAKIRGMCLVYPRKQDCCWLLSICKMNQNQHLSHAVITP